MQNEQATVVVSSSIGLYPGAKIRNCTSGEVSIVWDVVDSTTFTVRSFSWWLYVISVLRITIWWPLKQHTTNAWRSLRKLLS